MLIDDFATWTEKVRRRLLRDNSTSDAGVYESLPAGVPVSLVDSIEFLDVLLGMDIPEDIREKGERWKDKLAHAVRNG